MGGVALRCTSFPSGGRGGVVMLSKALVVQSLELNSKLHLNNYIWVSFPSNASVLAFSTNVVLKIGDVSYGEAPPPCLNPYSVCTLLFVEMVLLPHTLNGHRSFFTPQKYVKGSRSLRHFSRLKAQSFLLYFCVVIFAKISIIFFLYLDKAATSFG